MIDFPPQHVELVAWKLKLFSPHKADSLFLCNMGLKQPLKWAILHSQIRLLCMRLCVCVHACVRSHWSNHVSTNQRLRGDACMSLWCEWHSETVCSSWAALISLSVVLSAERVQRDRERETSNTWCTQTTVVSFHYRNYKPETLTMVLICINKTSLLVSTVHVWFHFPLSCGVSTGDQFSCRLSAVYECDQWLSLCPLFP